MENFDFGDRQPTKKMKKYFLRGTIRRSRLTILFAAALLTFSLLSGPGVPTGSEPSSSGIGLDLLRSARAGNTYANLSQGAFSYTLSAATANQISSNNNWSSVPSMEGYAGTGLTATHGVNPQTVLTTEFANNALPVTNSTQVNANKGNPNAFNAGGVTEFDSGTYIALGLQGNVQANPYIVFYLNTTGMASTTISYDIIDIDGGSNNAVSPVALQYRVGETGPFTNLPDGFVADATDGPNQAGRVSSRIVALPFAALNQPQVQVRLITTNAADTTGGSTPDEWIGVNNVVVTALVPSAAGVTIGGRVTTPDGQPVYGARIMMSDIEGNIRTAMTNSFGFYQFEDVVAGETYVFSGSAKRYSLVTKYTLYTAEEDFSDLDFVAY